MTDPKGRRRRNPERTRSAVLRAAEKLFSRRGYSGTSMRDIARTSGVSQPLIHHHFGSKQDLYAAVRQRAIDRVRENQEPWLQCSRGTAAELLEAVGARFAFDRDNPTVRRLGTWARLEGDNLPWPGEAEVYLKVCQHIREAEEDGEIREDIDPFLLAVMVVAMTRHWWDNREVLAKLATSTRQLTGASDEGKSMDDAYLEQIIGFLKRAVVRPRRKA